MIDPLSPMNSPVAIFQPLIYMMQMEVQEKL